MVVTAVEAVAAATFEAVAAVVAVAAVEAEGTRGTIEKGDNKKPICLSFKFGAEIMNASCLKAR